MKKLTIIITVLMLPLFLTACTKKDGSSGINLLSRKDKDNEAEEIKGSLMDIMKSKKNVKCTGTFETETGKMFTTVYASNDKSYTETEVVSDDINMKTYMIMDGDWMYMWGDDEYSMPTKMSVSAIEAAAEDLGPEYSKEESMKKAAQYQEQWDYKCVNWIPNQSKFNPPSNIEFMDLTQMMQDFMSPDSLNSLKEVGCNACNSLPTEEERVDCRLNIGC